MPPHFLSAMKVEDALREEPQMQQPPTQEEPPAQEGEAMQEDATTANVAMKDLSLALKAEDAFQDGDATMVEDSSQEPQRQPSSQEQTVNQEPMSEYDRLRAHLKKDPHDATAWNMLIEQAEESADADRIKDAYEALLENYPNTVRTARSTRPSEHR